MALSTVRLFSIARASPVSSTIAARFLAPKAGEQKRFKSGGKIEHGNFVILDEPGNTPINVLNTRLDNLYYIHF